MTTIHTDSAYKGFASTITKSTDPVKDNGDIFSKDDKHEEGLQNRNLKVGLNTQVFLTINFHNGGWGCLKDWNNLCSIFSGATM